MVKAIIVIFILIVINFFLLTFSCNKDVSKPDRLKDNID